MQNPVLLRPDAAVLPCLAGRVSNIVGIFRYGRCQAEECCVGTGERRPWNVTDVPGFHHRIGWRR